MNTLDRDLAGILDLLLKFEHGETLSMDEFDALEHFEQLGYWLDSTEPLPFEDTSLMLEPDGTLLCQVDDSNPHYPVVYYLRRGQP